MDHKNEGKVITCYLLPQSICKSENYNDRRSSSRSSCNSNLSDLLNQISSPSSSFDDDVTSTNDQSRTTLNTDYQNESQKGKRSEDSMLNVDNQNDSRPRKLSDSSTLVDYLKNEFIIGKLSDNSILVDAYQGGSRSKKLAENSILNNN